MDILRSPPSHRLGSAMDLMQDMSAPMTMGTKPHFPRMAHTPFDLLSLHDGAQRPAGCPPAQPRMINLSKLHTPKAKRGTGRAAAGPAPFSTPLAAGRRRGRARQPADQPTPVIDLSVDSDGAKDGPRPAWKGGCAHTSQQPSDHYRLGVSSISIVPDASGHARGHGQAHQPAHHALPDVRISVAEHAAPSHGPLSWAPQTAAADWQSCSGLPRPRSASQPGSAKVALDMPPDMQPQRHPASTVTSGGYTLLGARIPLHWSVQTATVLGVPAEPSIWQPHRGHPRGMVPAGNGPLVEGCLPEGVPRGGLQGSAALSARNAAPLATSASLLSPANVRPDSLPAHQGSSWEDYMGQIPRESSRVHSRGDLPSIAGCYKPGPEGGFLAGLQRRMHSRVDALLAIPPIWDVGSAVPAAAPLSRRPPERTLHEALRSRAQAVQEVRTEHMSGGA